MTNALAFESVVHPVGVRDAPRCVEEAAREQLAVGLHRTGLTAHAIARARRISPRTVHKHLENVYRTLGTHDRLQAVTVARRLGLLPPF